MTSIRAATIVLFLAVLAGTPTGFAAASSDTPPKMNNADVIKLVRAGLSAETITAAIAASRAEFDIGADAIVALSKEGVSEPVIRTMIEAMRNGGSSKGAHTAPAVPSLDANASARPASSSSVPSAASREEASRPDASKATSRREGRAVPSSRARRFEVAVHRSEYVRCDRGEIRIDGKGIATSGCADLDFRASWTEVEKVCTDFGFRGVIVVSTARSAHRLSTQHPAAAEEIAAAMESAARRTLSVACR